ncbi:MAG TPA: cytidine deaminase [candidate division Zixibacteria bacterium]|nr:cytidine deaminase [candidate division Zixibacteria bacterium]
MDEQVKSKLLEAAAQALENAYSPYSGISVAAAVMDDRGRIFSGVNVENASLGLTICAERNAIARAVADGAKSIEAVLIISSIGAIPPCGACRQVIAEFAMPETPILLAFEGKIIEERTLGELLPDAFKLNRDKGRS